MVKVMGDLKTICEELNVVGEDTNGDIYKMLDNADFNMKKVVQQLKGEIFRDKSRVPKSAKLKSLTTKADKLWDEIRSYAREVR